MMGEVAKGPWKKLPVGRDPIAKMENDQIPNDIALQLKVRDLTVQVEVLNARLDDVIARIEKYNGGE